MRILHGKQAGLEPLCPDSYRDGEEKKKVSCVLLKFSETHSSKAFRTDANYFSGQQ
jgi:hypothetical protein